jgi:putative ABC transport system permease protein
VIGWRLRRTVRLAAKSLWLHRLRSVLTGLGMFFGVGSVVAMLAIGEGASRDAQQQFLRLGSRNVIVRSVKPPESSSASTQRTWVIAYGLMPADVVAIRETVPGISRVVPRRDVPMDLWHEGRKVQGHVFGTTPEYREVTTLEVAEGRFLTAEDGDARSPVAVLGAAAAAALFPAGSALGGHVRIGTPYYTVVGVLAPRGTAPASGAGASGEEDLAAFVPLESMLERFSPLIQVRASGSRINERVELHQVVVETSSTEAVPAAAASLRSLLAKRHPKQDVRMTVPLELLEEAARTKRIFTIVLASIAGACLLVGGIGIMNIMLANVTERTREIGIRRALGARRKDIVFQFLAETVLLAGFGGVLGLALGVALPQVVERFTELPTYVTAWSMALAVAVSAAVGIGFGLYPATRAADLDPVEALRHD